MRIWLRLAVAMGLIGAAGAAEACSVAPWEVSDFPQSYVTTPGGNVGAWFDGASDRYAHGVLGDAVEPTVLGLISPVTSPACGVELTLDQSHVFEDIAPRLADLDGDDRPEVIVIRSHRARGAQVAVYGWDGVEAQPRLVATSPYIGRAFRWLAIAGIADFDGSGRADIAFVDRPHLAKVLRIVTLRGEQLVEIASAPGFSNHRIGEDFISGGVRHCGGVPEIITADARWSRVQAVALVDGALVARDLSPFDGQGSFAAAMACK